MAEKNVKAPTAAEKKGGGFQARKWVTRIALILLPPALLLMTLYQFGYLKYPWEKDKPPPKPVVAGDLFPGEGDADDGYLPNMSKEQILAQMQRVADASQLSFKINARPVFANGNAKGDLAIENPHYNVYPMVVQIFLDETGEMIYDSGGLLPDRHIYNAKLLKVLNAGTYKATAVFNAYDPGTGLWQGKTQAALVITVQN